MIAGMTVTGCAAPGTGPEGSHTEKGTPTMSPSGSPTGPPDGGPTFSPSPLPSGKPAGSVVTVQGTIEPGVESGCLILKHGGVVYNVLGGDRTLLRPGRTVRVVGEVRNDVLTICQQGIPLMVKRAEPV
jgi:hypothetical protein